MVIDQSTGENTAYLPIQQSWDYSYSITMPIGKHIFLSLFLVYNFVKVVYNS